MCLFSSTRAMRTIEGAIAPGEDLSNTSPPSNTKDNQQMAKCTIRYWAAAKEAAGTAQEDVEADTLAEALEAACRLHPDDRFLRVLGASSLLVDERPVGARPHGAVAVADGTVIEVLPPFAGG
jgi:sulfur-carrier protein